MAQFSGLWLHLGNLSRLSTAQSRSLSPENFDGSVGGGGRAEVQGNNHPARDLGVGWKVSPCITIAPGETRELGAIEGPGALQQIWMTPSGHWRHKILRIYWDNADFPRAVEPKRSEGGTASRCNDWLCCGIVARIINRQLCSGYIG